MTSAETAAYADAFESNGLEDYHAICERTIKALTSLKARFSGRSAVFFLRGHYRLERSGYPQFVDCDII